MSQNAGSLTTRTHDWEEFRTLDGCARKAGVARRDLPALVAKELVDNALDAGATCKVEIRGSVLSVSDDGPGLEGSDEEIAELFSIGRAMVSTKRLRRITRGALGNGLRVGVGTALASGGRLKVTTRGRRMEIVPHDDGTSTVRNVTLMPTSGTCIEVELGGELADALEDEDHVLRWARQAIALGETSSARPVRSSPWWYAGDAFHALCQGAGKTTVRDLVALLDGCTGPRAGQIAGEHRGRAAADLTLEEAESVLGAAREVAREVTPCRLGTVGKDALGPGYLHAKAVGEFEIEPGRGDVEAQVPFAVECWARASEDESQVVVAVNRTPVVADVTAVSQAWVGARAKTLLIHGCGIDLNIKGVGRDPAFEVWINVQCPALGFTTDGKAPDFGPLKDELLDSVTRAVRKAMRGRPRPEVGASADIVGEALRLWQEEWDPEDIVPTLRQIFYALAVAGIVTKDKPGYDRVGRALTRARVDGQYPWEGLADPLRHVRRVEVWDGVDGFLAEKRGEYRLDKWKSQPQRVELWTEKDALTGALEPLAVELEVPLLVARGYASATAKHDALVRIQDPKPITILYVGDFDPSGLDMLEGAERWIREKAGDTGHVTFRRLAVTEADLLSGKYLTLPVNHKDARAAKYRDQYGDEVIEAEALPPAELRRRIREAVLACRDEALWQADLEREAAHRAEVIRRLGG